MSNHLSSKRFLALILAVAMLLTVGFVMPVAADGPVELGALHESATHPEQTDGGEIYVNCDNTIPEEWKNFYAESADCVKLLKSGSDTVYNIGALTEYGTTDGILVSHNGTEFIIRNSQWNLNCAGQSGASPLAYGDTMIVGGNFTGANGTVVHITTTYITKDADGKIHCSDKLEAGRATNPAAATDGFTFTAEYRCFTQTWANYYAASDGNVKLFRNGAVTEIGQLTEYGTTDGILVSRNGNTIFVRNSQWNLNCAGHSSLSPMTAGDVIYIGGIFTGSSGETFRVTPTYIYKDSEGAMTASDAFNVGTLSANASQPAMTSDGIIYTTAERGYAGNWQDYKAESADCVKLRKSGSDTAVSIGIPDGYGCTDGIIVKRGDNVFCLKSTQWLLNCAGHSELSPMAEGDVMIVEGNFTGVSDGITAHIEKTYITIKDGVLVFSTTDPAEGGEEPEPTVIEAGVMLVDANHASLNNGCFYFTMADNAIPYDTGWNNEFYAVSADCIKLIRDGGEETAIALTAPGRAPFIKYAQSGYYFNGGDAWHLGDAAPLVNGDIVIVEGQFTNGTVTFNVSKSVIIIGNDGALTFATEVPVIIEAGVMKAASNTQLNGGGFYFTMDDNDIPYTDNDWSNEFYATDANCIKLIRDGGEETAIALTTPGRAPFIKYGQNSYYFNGSDAWHLGNAAPLVNGDILIVEGIFTNGTATFNVSKSVIIIGESGALTFATEIPVIIEAGVMQAAANTQLNGGGFYFTMADNDIPYTDNDWSNEFYAVSADCIKLIRNGGEAAAIAQTTPGRAPFIKYGQNSYYFNGSDAWHLGSSAPLAAGDILIVEGNFTNGEATFHVSKSVITIGADGTVSFSTVLLPAISHTIDLAEDISVIYAVSKDAVAEFDSDSLYLSYSYNKYTGNTVSETVTGELQAVGNRNLGYWYFILSGVTAVEMSTEVSAVLHLSKDSAEFTVADTYSVATYAYNQLNKEGIDNATKTVCANLLRYGAAAQTYKNTHTDALPDSAMTDAQKAYLTDLDTVNAVSRYAALSDLENPSVTWFGKTFQMNTRVELMFVFNLTNFTGSREDLHLVVNYTDYTGAEKTYDVPNSRMEVYNPANNTFYFCADCLRSADMRTVLSVAVYEGETQVSTTMQYSVESYTANKTGAVQNLCKCLLAYSDACAAKFAG